MRKILLILLAIIFITGIAVAETVIIGKIVTIKPIATGEIVLPIKTISERTGLTNKNLEKYVMPVSIDKILCKEYVCTVVLLFNDKPLLQDKFVLTATDTEKEFLEKRDIVVNKLILEYLSKINQNKEKSIPTIVDVGAGGTISLK